MKKKFRALHDYVLVKRLGETHTASGIVIPETAAEKSDQGEVIAAGPGKKDEKGALVALQVKVNDVILFRKYAGQAVKIEDEELLFVREEDIFAVLEQ